MRRWQGCIALLACLLIGACAPRLQPAGGEIVAPVAIAGPTHHWQAGDGRVLPLRSWMPEGGKPPKAVILAIHGFNDYSTAFTEAAEWWAARGVATYAPDQRGFGLAPYTGYWAGEDRMADDVRELSAVLRQTYPGLPLYWLGESMGGAVVLHALTRSEMAERPKGVVLVAPAVWGRASMPMHYRLVLWLTSYTIPWKTFTGSGLKIQASDNIDMLRRLSRDPLFIKATRVDAIHGLVNLMDAAAEARPTGVPLLLLYGVQDEVIPKPPVESFVAKLRATPRVDLRVAVYPQGWHMLLRDLQAETVWRDVADWMVDPDAVLPSGAERHGLPLFKLDEKTENE